MLFNLMLISGMVLTVVLPGVALLAIVYNYRGRFKFMLAALAITLTGNLEIIVWAYAALTKPDWTINNPPALALVTTLILSADLVVLVLFCSPQLNALYEKRHPVTFPNIDRVYSVKPPDS